MRPAPLLAALVLGLLAPAAGGDDLAARAARSYALEPGAAPLLAPGERGAVSVAIHCEPGVHVQRQAPLRASASASAGLELGKARLGWADVRWTQDTPEVVVPVAAVTAGAGEVTLRLDFFVCSKDWCVRQERALALAVDVAAPPAAPPAAGSGAAERAAR